jgi:hypothetical protein
VNRNIGLFNGNGTSQKNLKNRQKQITLDRFLSKEKSCGGNINEPQLSISRFQMKEG